ncbi:MAG: hypothetical protein ABI728_11120 [Betaproteobacteria bacterium]
MTKPLFMLPSNRRRALLQACCGGLALGAAQSAGLPPLFSRALAADATGDKRILVVLELSGGNDGLNTLVPYSDDAYYRHRPKIGIRREKLRKIDERFEVIGVA